MEKYCSHRFVFLIYLIGINLYCCYWYLGSEGYAVRWDYGPISFYQVCIALNLAAPFGFLTLEGSGRLTSKFPVFHFRSVNLELVSQSLIYAFAFSTIYIVALVAINRFQEVQSILDYTGTTIFVSLFMYHFILGMIVISLLNLKHRLGGLRRVFGYISPKTNPPREVERGFMFLDLNNSTGIAEKLQNEAYSAFLRDCFEVLDQIIEKRDGFEIYQYVGDQAIVHWDFASEKLCKEAIPLFESFKAKLHEKHDYFLTTYQVIPSFKSAIHGGLVTESELGKRVVHSAFHGDVMNTSARILGLCHKHNTDLLVSDEYFKRISSGYVITTFTQVNDVVLNGKIHRLTLYKPRTNDYIISQELKTSFLFNQKMTNSQ